MRKWKCSGSRIKKSKSFILKCKFEGGNMIAVQIMFSVPEIFLWLSFFSLSFSWSLFLEKDLELFFIYFGAGGLNVNKSFQKVFEEKKKINWDDFFPNWEVKVPFWAVLVIFWKNKFEIFFSKFFWRLLRMRGFRIDVHFTEKFYSYAYKI